MARYDRVARLPLPDRTAAFTGWSTLLDLARGRRDERDGHIEPGGDREQRRHDERTAAGHLDERVRARFLAVRLLNRFVDRDGRPVPVGSLLQQIEAIEAEVDALPAGDEERVRLDRLLRVARRRSSRALAAIAYELADAADARGDGGAGYAFRRAADALAADGAGRAGR